MEWRQLWCISKCLYDVYIWQQKVRIFKDYARLQIILREGGIYFDVDVEVVRPLDELLRYPVFLGFETEEYVNTGVGFGAERGNKIVEGMLKRI